MKKSNLCLFLLLVMVCVPSLGQTIEEKIQAHNEYVHLFSDWCRDPYIVIGPDDKYYMCYTNLSSNYNKIRFPIYVSDDLANWTLVGRPYALSDLTYWNEYNKNNLRLWAPELHYINNKWICTHTTSSGPGAFVISNSNSQVPFEKPYSNWPSSEFERKHDPNIFQDDDGTLWLVWGATNIRQIKADLSGFSGSTINVRPSNRKIGHEGSQLLKIEGKYVIFGTAWSTDNPRDGTYNLYYTTADNITGPYGPRKFAGRCLGHGTVFKDKLGRWWCTAFANGSYKSPQDVVNNGVPRGTATTMNKGGATIVPMEICMHNGDIVVYSKDPYYRNPGNEEAQNFPPINPLCTGQSSNPVANAGPNQTVADADGNGSETVSLNGSASNDSDGTITSYVWSKGGSQIATGATPNVTLAVGTHNITLTVTDNDGATDTDVVTINVTGLTTVPAKIEAESFSAQSGIQTESTSDVGGGDNIGFINNGDWTEYEVNATQAGSYDIDFRVASATAGGTITIQSDGSNVGSVNVGSTGGWQSWTTVSTSVTLPAGAQTIRLAYSGSASFLFNINWFELTTSIVVPQDPIANAGPNQTVTDSDDNGVETVTLDGSGSSDSDGTISSYVWTEGGSQIATGVSPNVTLAVGTHNITLTVTDNDGLTDTDQVTITVNAGSTNGIPVPGIVEAEDFDFGAYFDTDAANKGNAGIRTDEDVDLDNKNGVICIGWCAAGEWTEYTIDVAQSGNYLVKYSFSTNANGNPKSFSFAIDGSSIGTVNIAGNDPINNVGNTVFETRELGEISLTAGIHTLRWTAGSNAICYDKVEFELVAGADTESPSVPTGLSASNIGETSLSLSWNASTDNVGVTGYKVYQDGSEVADVAGTSASISGLTCETSYSFTVSAYDAAANESAQSGAEAATTSTCPQVGDYIFIGHVASGNRLGASTGVVDTRPSGNTGANVQWEEVASDGGYFYLVNVATGQKLNAPTKRTIDVVPASTTGNTAQWQWVAQGGGEYFLQSREWGKYFHVAADGVSDISTKWNANLAGIRWTITAVPKSVEGISLTDNSISIYPNPASSTITIELDELHENANIEIYNAAGQLEIAKTLTNNLESINVEQLQHGLFIVKVISNNNISIQTLIVE